MLTKEELRQKLLLKRRRLSPEKVNSCSTSICTQLAKHPIASKATVIAGYCAHQGEIDLRIYLQACLDQGKDIYLPQAHKNTYRLGKVLSFDNDLVSGPYGIPEPNHMAEILDISQSAAPILLWLVPGVSFDARGGRLGMGTGVYDRLLKHHEGYSIGVGYDWQVLDQLPLEPHDQFVDEVLTAH